MGTSVLNIFGWYENRRWILSLYNAVNGSNHTNPDDIDINTIGNAVYMGMKNDVSFIFNEYMNIYEQQSTYNPNIPLRELMYVSKLYGKYVHEKGLNIYGSQRIKIPVPKLVVFYNGVTDKKDEILNLYELFDNEEKAAEADISVSVRMININYGENNEILNNCKPLMEYSHFVSMIRKNLETMDVETAVDAAVDGVPKDYEIWSLLVMNREEVKDMLLTEYNEEETMKLFYEDGKAEGRINTLRDLVKDGILSVSEAAGREGLTEELFVSKMK